MDHHCPWIYNCVGFQNYKCFFLLLFYSAVDCHLIVWTMADTVIKKATERDAPFFDVFLILFGETLAFFFAALTTLFIGFHMYLMANSMTTIEFCERVLPKSSDPTTGKVYDGNLFSEGCLTNITNVLGRNPLLWFVPTAPEGDGCTFSSGNAAVVPPMGGMPPQKSPRQDFTIPPYSDPQMGGSYYAGSPPASYGGVGNVGGAAPQAGYGFVAR
jgi:hypothetical protein